jgi:hypothetical protein
MYPVQVIPQVQDQCTSGQLYKSYVSIGLGGGSYGGTVRYDIVASA